MKALSKCDGDQLLRKLSSDIKKQKSNKHIIIAERTNKEMKDEAKQSAVSYWMMGWTWDEIETVLEDAEYTKEAISFAMKEAQKYAKKVLNDGPFAGTAMGQGIKLINGSIGTVTDIRADYVEVLFSDDNLRAQIDAKQIDKQATAKLNKAFSLRKAAASKLTELTDPLGFVHLAKEVIYAYAQETPNDGLQTELSSALTRLIAVQKQFKELETSAHSLNAKWEEQKGTWKPQSNEEKEFAQLVVAAATQEQEIFHLMEDTLTNEVTPAMTELYNTLHEGYQLDSSDSAAVQSHVSKFFTDALNKIEGHLAELGDDNDKLRAYVTHFDTFDADEPNNALWQKDAMKWANSMWDSSNKFYASWVKNISNSLTSTTAAITKARSNVIFASKKSKIAKIIKNNS